MRQERIETWYTTAFSSVVAAVVGSSRRRRSQQAVRRPSASRTLLDWRAFPRRLRRAFRGLRRRTTTTPLAPRCRLRSTARCQAETPSMLSTTHDLEVTYDSLLSCMPSLPPPIKRLADTRKPYYQPPRKVLPPVSVLGNRRSRNSTNTCSPQDSFAKSADPASRNSFRGSLMKAAPEEYKEDHLPISRSRLSIEEHVVNLVSDAHEGDGFSDCDSQHDSQDMGSIQRNQLPRKSQYRRLHSQGTIQLTDSRYSIASLVNSEFSAAPGSKAGSRVSSMHDLPAATELMGHQRSIDSTRSAGTTGSSESPTPTRGPEGWSRKTLKPDAGRRSRKSAVRFSKTKRPTTHEEPPEGHRELQTTSLEEVGSPFRGKSIFKHSKTARITKIKASASSKLLKAKKVQERELLQRQFSALPGDEAAALTQVFQRFDRDFSGSLEAHEVVEALAELGLRGCNSQEKREIIRICAEETKSWSVKYRDDSADDDLAAQSGQICVDLLYFAMKVVPQVRERLLELQAGETLMQFYLHDKDGTGKQTVSQCIELARSLGLDQRLMEHELKARRRNHAHDAAVGVDEFQLYVTRCREHTHRLVKTRERALQEEYELDEGTFAECRQDIVSLFETFCRYKQHDGKLLSDQVVPVMREFGLQPCTPELRQQVQDMLDNEVDIIGKEFTFQEFIRFFGSVRDLMVKHRSSLLEQEFERYDRDKSGTLSVPEISAILVDTDCAPVNKKEQEEMGLLIEAVDRNGDGLIDYSEFLLLVQRIDEKIRGLRFEEEVEHALTLGFSDSQLRDLRWVFDSIDTDGSGRLDKSEVRIGLAKMDKKVSQQAFDAAFDRLDMDGSGELDFIEFLDFMQLMRDGEGVFGDDTQKLATKARFLDASVLRRVLEHFRLSKSYLTSLIKEELVELFCNCFQLNPNANLSAELNINSVGDLFKLAKKVGEQTSAR
eukprot:TRINITY_DN15203_c0_g1_i2.p1 TRINITY_DN15203_c0_g1~~TRINITY_DN15203_c0_g1_i2.p1  ORF type:complete len:945 (-),score=237.99 TRINITY_DN15203_c0_g1_i2:154-2988(-)